MKNLKTKIALVLVLLLSIISCTNDDFEEIPVLEFENIENRDASNNTFDNEMEEDDPDDQKSKDD